jgi:RNA polymerase sigma-70 factor (ECF subfamily)
VLNLRSGQFFLHNAGAAGYRQLRIAHPSLLDGRLNMDPAPTVDQCELERIRDGDRDQLDRVIARLCDRFRSLASRMLSASARLRPFVDTDDLLQHALLSFREALTAGNVKDQKHLLALGGHLIRHQLIDVSRHYFGEKRAEGRRVNVAIGAVDSSSSGNPGLDPAQSNHDPQRLALWTAFHEEVARLPDPEREAVEKIWYADLSVPEAAAVLGTDVRVVRKLWTAARLKLARFLKDGGYFETRSQ